MDIDFKKDLLPIKIIKYFHPRINFTWEEIIFLIEKRPKLFKANNDFKRSINITIIQAKYFGMRLKILFRVEIIFYLKDLNVSTFKMAYIF